MRTAQKTSTVFMWIFMAFYALTNVGTAIFLIITPSANRVSIGTSLITSVGLMLISCVLYHVAPRKRAVWCILGAVAAVVMLAASLALRQAYPVRIGFGGNDVGISVWKQIWRHCGIALVPVLMLTAWLTGRSAAKEDEVRAKSTGKGYDLSGDSIFRD